MKKQIVSLFVALALCLTLLPATALAAENAPTTLYVGNYQITNGNATTYFKAGSTQGSLVDGSENDWTVKYDPSTATLTLNGATITGNDNISSVPYGAGIYAQCNSGQPVTLTIELIGENIITGNYGIYVNAEMSANSYGTDASLNITGNGSLIVTGTNSHGLFVKSGTGNASLTINDASVVANTTHTYSGPAGICVQSSVSATSSPNLSLAVDGGSLTASGTGNSDGILLYVGSSQATGATTSLTVTENAIVRAKNGIKAERVDKPTPSGAGIVFDGGEGTVYGSVTLQENITIDEGESLTIPDGASLNTGSREVIVNGGALTGGDKITGTVKYAPTITTESLPNGTVNKEYNQTLAATGSDTITWSLADGSSLPAGLSLDENTGKIYGTPTMAEESTFTVTATNAYGSASREFTLTISAPTTIPVTGVSLDQNALTLTEGDTVQLTATVEPANATNKGVTWKSSDDEIAKVDNGVVTAVAPGAATITVTTEDGSKTATCAVTVTHGNMIHTPKKDATCTAAGNKEYWTCEVCGKHFRDAEGETEIDPADTVLPQAAHQLAKTEAKAPTCTEAGNKEYWTCETCGKHFSDAEGETEIDLADTGIQKAAHQLAKTEAKAPTCTEAGNKEYWTCETCGKHFSDAEGETEIDLADTGIQKAAHQLAKTEAKAPTCTEAGNKEYWTCETCGKHFSDAEGKDELTDTDVPPTGHTLTATEAKPATHLAEGNVAYWHCAACGRYFADADAAQPIELADTVLAKLPDHVADATGWHADASGHWQVCTCGQYIAADAHTFAWVTDRPATATQPGQRHEECTVCGYQKAAQVIPATGAADPQPTPTAAPQSEHPEIADAIADGTWGQPAATAAPTAAPVPAVPPTGDSDPVILWAVLAVAAAGGLAFIIIRKRR